MQPAVHVAHVSKTFNSGRRALKGINLAVRPGEMVALIGASGSGKSTLLRHIAGLAAADRGSHGLVAVNGAEVQRGGRLSRNIRSVRSQIGFVFQQFNLVGRLSVMTNVLAGRLGRTPFWRSMTFTFTKEERMQAVMALGRVGIAECAHQRASTLSGGQQQRAAIARALVQQAKVILADEPIASLDPESARRVMETLAEINRTDGITVLVSLHQVGFALRYCGRIVALKDGQVVYDGPTSAVSPDLLASIYDSDPEVDFSEVEPVVQVPRGRRRPLNSVAAATGTA